MLQYSTIVNINTINLRIHKYSVKENGCWRILFLFRMAFLQLGQFLLLVLFVSLLRWWSWWFKIEWWLLGKMASFHTGWGGAEGWQSLRHFLCLAGVGLDALCIGRYLSTVMLLWEFFVYVGFSAVLLGVELCLASYCFLCMRILSRLVMEIPPHTWGLT